MARATMWWARSVRSRMPLFLEADWVGDDLRITGRVEGPDAGAVTWYPNFNYSVRLRAQFSLTTDRMPSTGTVFSSAPVLDLRGSLEARTRNWRIFDKPSAVCDAVLEQRAYRVDGPQVVNFARSIRTKNLVEIKNDGNASDSMPNQTISFAALSFALDRSRNLRIDLTVTLKMFLEGGDLHFSRFGPDFIVAPSQWSIHSIY